MTLKAEGNPSCSPPRFIVFLLLTTDMIWRYRTGLIWHISDLHCYFSDNFEKWELPTQPRKANHQDFGLAICFRRVQIFRSVCKGWQRFEYFFFNPLWFWRVIKIAKSIQFFLCIIFWNFYGAWYLGYCKKLKKALMLHNLISRRKSSVQVFPACWCIDGFHRELYVGNITEKKIGMESGGFSQVRNYQNIGQRVWRLT